MDMSGHSIKDLGIFIELFVNAGYLDMAQTYLNEIQERLNVMQELAKVSVAAAVVRATRENDLLAELPMVETKEPSVVHKTLLDVSQPVVEPEPQVESPLNEGITDQAEPGIIRDEDGKVTHVSVQAGNPGYDPDIHENTALKIYCDGKYIEKAHTADTIAGTVRYYEKNAQGRIKTLTVHGNVVIEGLD